MTAPAVLTQFATTGELGPIRCGTPLNTIAEALGPPWDIGRITQRRRWPHLFSYGDVEICVCHCRTVTTISVQAHRNPVELPNPTTNTLTAYPSRLTWKTITDSLTTAGCRWHTRPDDLPDRIELHTEPAGVSFTFRTGHEPLLEQAGHTITTHDCTPPPHDLPDDGLGM